MMMTSTPVRKLIWAHSSGSVGQAGEICWGSGTQDCAFATGRDGDGKLFSLLGVKSELGIGTVRREGEKTKKNKE